MKNKKEKRQTTGKRTWKMTAEEKEIFTNIGHKRAVLSQLLVDIGKEQDEGWDIITKRLGVDRKIKIVAYLKEGIFREV